MRELQVREHVPKTRALSEFQTTQNGLVAQLITKHSLTLLLAWEELFDLVSDPVK